MANVKINTFSRYGSFSSIENSNESINIKRINVGYIKKLFNNIIRSYKKHIQYSASFTRTNSEESVVLLPLGTKKSFSSNAGDIDYLYSKQDKNYLNSFYLGDDETMSDTGSLGKDVNEFDIFLSDQIDNLNKALKITDKNDKKLKLYITHCKDATAQYNLGLRLMKGKGVKKDIQQGLEWYRLAANQGHAMAQNNLGYFYYEQRDYKKAYDWLNKAAQQGHAKAYYTLGLMSYFGRGVRKDLDDAHEYSTASLIKGQQPAKEMVDFIKELLKFE